MTTKISIAELNKLDGFVPDAKNYNLPVIGDVQFTKLCLGDMEALAGHISTLKSPTQIDAVRALMATVCWAGGSRIGLQSAQSAPQEAVVQFAEHYLAHPGAKMAAAQGISAVCAVAHEVLAQAQEFSQMLLRFAKDLPPVAGSNGYPTKEQVVRDLLPWVRIVIDSFQSAIAIIDAIGGC